MANTWHASSQGVAYASGKKLINVFNGSASTRNIDTTGIWCFNNGTASITGVLLTLQVMRISSASGGTAITPVAHDTSNAALNANTTAGTNQTNTSGSIFRQVLYQNDEPVVTTLDMDALLTLVPFATIWDRGYGDTNVQYIRSRTGVNEGVALLEPGTTAVGTCDVELEFTDQ